MSVFKSGLFFVLGLLSLSCSRSGSDQPAEGKVSGNTYTSNEIGWTMEIPPGWEIISQDQLQADTKKGMGMVEKTIEDKVDYSGLKHLINFKKDNSNIFQSSSEPFSEAEDGNWNEHHQMMKEILHNTYISRGMKIDTSSSIQNVDGLEFKVFKIKIFNPGGNVMLNQELYSRLINDFQFGVNINYNNEQDRETMMNVWTRSKFKK